LIGDPTGKSITRPEVEQAEIKKNMDTYIDQVVKILKTDKKVFSWIGNSDWFYSPADINDAAIDKDIKAKIGKSEVLLEKNSYLGKAYIYENTRMQKTHLGLKKLEGVTFRGFLWTLRHITHSQLIERDMFQERIKKGQPLFMHEMMYPVLQAIDSLLIHDIYGSCDLEIGGTDQTFNMLIGREVMKINKKPEQSVMAMKILVGTDGKEKMSKSLDNYISITDSPEEMYGKVMSIPDTAIEQYWELATNFSGKADLDDPMDSKMLVARNVVSIYHNESAADSAEKNFIDTFQKKEWPAEALVVNAAAGQVIGEVLKEAGVVTSMGDWQRLVAQNGVQNWESGEVITDPRQNVNTDLRLKIGKRRFVAIKLI
jgi:tyrosyl-tRNA synthetase